MRVVLHKALLNLSWCNLGIHLVLAPCVSPFGSSKGEAKFFSGFIRCVGATRGKVQHAKKKHLTPQHG